MSVLLPENSLIIVRGSSRTLTLKVKDISGNPINLTGSTIYFTVKRRIEDTLPIIQKISTNIAQIEITDPSGGVAKIYLQPGDTALDPCQYVYDVWVELSSGERYVVIKTSIFKIEKSVTVLI